jgi:hypothetical protein
MDAYITTENTFCDGVLKSLIFNQTELNDKKEKTVPKEQPILFGKKSVKIYPNPNKGRFIIGLTNFDGQAEVGVYSISGVMLYKQEIRDNAIPEINLPLISKGIYFVRVNNGREHFIRKMIVN